MGIIVSSLVVEMTRRCNMACRHCLRGDAENIDISREVIDSIAKNIDIINVITLSGGEPSLCVPLIKDLRNQLEINEVCVDGFYIVTNGLDTEKITDLACETLLWHSMCLENSGESEYSGLALSYDQYHSPIPKQNELILRGLSYFTEEKMYDDLKGLINEGRAYDNGIGTFSKDNDSIDIMFEGDDIVIDYNLYINVHGDVVPGCDFSYESQKELSWGNILEDSLGDILIRKYRSKEKIEFKSDKIKESA